MTSRGVFLLLIGWRRVVWGRFQVLAGTSVGTSSRRGKSFEHRTDARASGDQNTTSAEGDSTLVGSLQGFDPISKLIMLEENPDALLGTTACHRRGFIHGPFFDTQRLATDFPIAASKQSRDNEQT